MDGRRRLKVSVFVGGRWRERRLCKAIQKSHVVEREKGGPRLCQPQVSGHRSGPCFLFLFPFFLSSDYLIQY